MLQAMNTGHDGSLTTLHANSPADCVSRLTTMVRYAVELPVEVIESQIASAIDYIVQVARSADGRRFLCSVSQVGPKPNGAGCLVSPVYTRSSPDMHGVWVGQENAPAKRGRAA
jgi:pilus assembly protein CpaF